MDHQHHSALRNMDLSMVGDEDGGYSAAHLAASLPKPRLREMISIVDWVSARLASSARVVAKINDGQFNQEVMREIVVMEHVLERLMELERGR